MTAFKSWLPHSGRRYLISKNGEVEDAKGSPIRQSFEGNRWVVKLTWMFGYRNYDVSMLTYITHRPIELPNHLYLELEMLHADNDVSNCRVENLLYRFRKGPLEVEDMPGYYYVPFHEMYAITHNGVLKHTRLRNPLTWYVSKPCDKRNAQGGYSSCRVSINRGERSTMLFRHKALCLTFKPYGHNVRSLISNHIDGNPRNDHLDNLEWCTYAQNNKHAYAAGLRPNSSVPVLVKTIATGEIVRYPTANSAIAAHGKIVRRLYHESQPVVTDGIVSVKRDDGSTWDSENTSKVHRPKNRSTKSL